VYGPLSAHISLWAPARYVQAVCRGHLSMNPHQPHSLGLQQQQHSRESQRCSARTRTLSRSCHLSAHSGKSTARPWLPLSSAVLSLTRLRHCSTNHSASAVVPLRFCCGSTAASMDWTGKPLRRQWTGPVADERPREAASLRTAGGAAHPMRTLW
jgi:hypothetical protein